MMALTLAPNAKQEAALAGMVQALSCHWCKTIAQRPRRMPCGHSYCWDCGEECLRQLNHCATCRTPCFVNGLMENSSQQGAADRLRQYQSVLTKSKARAARLHDETAAAAAAALDQKAPAPAVPTFPAAAAASLPGILSVATEQPAASSSVPTAPAAAVRSDFDFPQHTPPLSQQPRAVLPVPKEAAPATAAAAGSAGIFSAIGAAPVEQRADQAAPVAQSVGGRSGATGRGVVTGRDGVVYRPRRAPAGSSDSAAESGIEVIARDNEDGSGDAAVASATSHAAPPAAAASSAASTTATIPQQPPARRLPSSSSLSAEPQPPPPSSIVAAAAAAPPPSVSASFPVNEDAQSSGASVGAITKGAAAAIAAPAGPVPLPSPRRLHVVATGLSMEQMSSIRAALKNMAGSVVTFSDVFNAKLTTHVITQAVRTAAGGVSAPSAPSAEAAPRQTTVGASRGTPTIPPGSLVAKRTLKLMMGVLTGTYIVTPEWVTASQAVGHLVDEGPFCVDGDSMAVGAPLAGRLRVATGAPPLLTGAKLVPLGPFDRLTEPEIRGLIQLAGGTVIPLGSPAVRDSDVIAVISHAKGSNFASVRKAGVPGSSVDQTWLLDCISHHKLLSYESYWTPGSRGE